MLNPDQIHRANFGGNHLIQSRAKFFDSQVEDSGLSIKWTIRGTEYYQVGDQEYEVQEGHFLVVNPGQTVRFYGNSEEYIEGICIYLEPTQLREIYAAQHQSLKQQLDLGTEVPAYPVLLNQMVWGLQDNLLGLWLANLREEDIATADESFYYAVAEMLLRSEQVENKKLHRLRAAKTGTKVELYRRLSLAATYIRDNFKQPLDLDELSQIACISKYHLIRTFRQVHGQSPMQLLYSCRLEHAKDLLRKRPELALKVVAKSAGFPSRRALTRKLSTGS